ncbi:MULTISPECIES: hypothetical protein [unclassified Acidovorax]|uniref:hypothetical protein n=1 Tax=unclassified Acidovorax TaxID=2684926 RepID=UPI001C45F778|nr:MULTISPECIES: hypothetical protein [unclassified Acidovorax]MBV7459819.1 hypothetical protein [Acidovorax sp. sif0632]MBV7464844.1 hypothetical protein [Acidovorax sp. sif0613]
MSLSTIRFADLPAMGQPLEGGTFAGITTHADGKHYAEVLLPDQGSDLNHPQAVAWAEALGAALPTRPIAALLFSNLKTQLRPSWHWLQETEGASYAWHCDFNDGYQDDLRKSCEGSAVAVRSIPLSA